MKENIAEKYLLKSKVAESYKSCGNDVTKREILAHYQGLLEENDLEDKGIFPHRVYSIYPAIALYHGLQQGGYGREEAEKILETVVLKTGKAMRETFYKMGKRGFFFPLFKKMCHTSTKTSYKLPYFDMRWTDHGKEKIAWECHKCHYHDEFLRYGCPELTKIFCRLDDVMYGNIPTATWARTKTIGDGDEVCDFCFLKTTT